MKSIISIFPFFAVPFIILGEKVSLHFPREVARLNTLAEKHTTINEALMLKENGFLGDGGLGFVFAGTFIENGHDVAIKFVLHAKVLASQREFEIYTYLNAINSTEAQKYGIPTVYYYGRWEGFHVMAITKLDKHLLDIANEHKLANLLDILILIRNFIIQSKYMHCRGVRHDDIKPENIMVRGHQSFLIDFDWSSKMLEDSWGGTWKLAAKRFHHTQNRRAIDDWESFLYSVGHLIGVRFEWLQPPKEFFQFFMNRYYGFLKKKTETIRNCINESIDNESLKSVINEFANEVFTDDDSTAFPDYDRLYELVNGEITKMHGNDSVFPPMFSWLTEAEKLTAKDEIESNPSLNIADIIQPSSIDFETFVYPHVNIPQQENSIPVDSQADIYT